ncbi:hypothetical protein [Microbacterium candidum]|uniref:Uncharacterized protein n=1 Tax=Microbacterium candidum TaxID=3041922 RepID=A0ABT7MUH5_9MICO|nr:hypothetical protein [Microbacterium sp. ASV49]MDL9978102.1 hypothetical protein [Microbacterium sp. ASV49]
MTENSSRFELISVTPSEWVIVDSHDGPQDAYGTVARIWEVDTNECEVTWMRDLARPTWYATAEDVLADLNTTPHRTKPVPIPHFAPHRVEAMDLAGV